MTIQVINGRPTASSRNNFSTNKVKASPKYDPVSPRNEGNANMNPKPTIIARIIPTIAICWSLLGVFQLNWLAGKIYNAKTRRNKVFVNSGKHPQL